MAAMRIMLALCLIFGGVALYGAYKGAEGAELVEKYAPASVVLDEGVFIQPSVVRSVFGENTPVSVHASPAGSTTHAAKSVAEDGTVHLWVPTTFVGAAASLTPGETQEYVVRELAKCSDQECVFDTANSPLDAGTLTDMARDDKVERAGETSQMFSTFVMAESFQAALDANVKIAADGFETARHGMDKIAEVAKSGDSAQTWTVALFNAKDLLGNVLGIVIIGAIVLLAGKFLFGGGGGGGGG